MERNLKTHEGAGEFQDELLHLSDKEFERRWHEAADAEYPFFLMVEAKRIYASPSRY